MPITDVLNELRRQQKTRTQKLRMQKICTPCSEAVSDIKTVFKTMSEDIDAVRNMHMNRLYRIKLKDGFTYSIEEVEARINRERCIIEQDLERYQNCCNQGKLSEKEPFRC